MAEKRREIEAQVEDKIALAAFYVRILYIKIKHYLPLPQTGKSNEFYNLNNIADDLFLLMKASKAAISVDEVS